MDNKIILLCSHGFIVNLHLQTYSINKITLDFKTRYLFWYNSWLISNHLSETNAINNNHITVGFEN